VDFCIVGFSDTTQNLDDMPKKHTKARSDAYTGDDIELTKPTRDGRE
jgi:hypothetical protein